MAKKMKKKVADMTDKEVAKDYQKFAEKVVKKPKEKKKEKPKFNLTDLQTEMDSFELELLTTDTSNEIPCYIIPFRSLSLQFITGGILGGKFHEISADSQAGKSYLLYELYSTVQEMGGVCYHQDGERAFTSQIAKACKIKDDGTFAKTHERDINKLFASMGKFIKAVRKKDKKCPILLGIDSFPSLQTTNSLKEFEAGTDPKGYAAMQKNAAFSMAIEKFVATLDSYDATLILINQTRTKKGIVFGDPTTTLGEEVIKFWCTQRIRGRHVTKLKTLVKSTEKKEPIKMEVGIVVEWKAIKNRLAAPFQKATIQTLFSKGILPYSGISELLTNHNRIEVTKAVKKKKNEEGEAKNGGILHIASDDTFENIVELINEHPEVLKPILVGELDDSELVEEGDSSEAVEE